MLGRRKESQEKQAVQRQPWAQGRARTRKAMAGNQPGQRRPATTDKGTPRRVLGCLDKTPGQEFVKPKKIFFAFLQNKNDFFMVQPASAAQAPASPGGAFANSVTPLNPEARYKGDLTRHQWRWDMFELLPLSELRHYPETPYFRVERYRLEKK